LGTNEQIREVELRVELVEPREAENNVILADVKDFEAYLVPEQAKGGWNGDVVL